MCWTNNNATPCIAWLQMLACPLALSLRDRSGDWDGCGLVFGLPVLGMARDHGRLHPRGAAFHSDRGSQHTSGGFHDWCAANSVTRSVGSRCMPGTMRRPSGWSAEKQGGATPARPSVCLTAKRNFKAPAAASDETAGAIRLGRLGQIRILLVAHHVRVSRTGSSPNTLGIGAAIHGLLHCIV
jgi:transposase InsO family protein